MLKDSVFSVESDGLIVELRTVGVDGGGLCVRKFVRRSWE